MTNYTQISSEERAVIAHLWRNKKSINHIAGELKRSWNTIEYELRENGKSEEGKRIVYRAIEAQKKHDARRENSKKKYRIIENRSDLEKMIRDRIVDKQHSPEQIAGDLALLNNHYTVVCAMTIYKYIYEAEDAELIKNLRRSGKKYIHNKVDKRVSKVAPKKNISERPAIVETRGRLGDGEGDTVKLQGLERVYTLVDRKSRYLFAEHMIDGKAETIHAITCKWQKFNKDFFQTITYDNGVEFAYHDLIKLDTGIDIYFANAYHSWERGTNENTNGLLRQYFPKGAIYDNLNNDNIQFVVNKLNHRPRKVLSFLTPYQVFILKMDPEIDGLKLKKRGS